MESARLATQISVASPSSSHHHMLLNSYFLWNYMYFINLQRCFPSVLKRLSSCKVRNRLRAQAVSSCPFKTNQNREKWVISLKKNVFYLSNLNAVMFGSAQSFEFKLKQHIIFALYTISDILFHCNIFEKKCKSTIPPSMFRYILCWLLELST